MGCGDVGVVDRWAGLSATDWRMTGRIFNDDNDGLDNDGLEIV